jgi:hypothetical protein
MGNGSVRARHVEPYFRRIGSGRTELWNGREPNERTVTGLFVF